MSRKIKELLKQYDQSQHSLDQKDIAKKIVEELKLKLCQKKK